MTDMELAEEIERRRGGTDMLNSVLMPHQWEQIIAALRRADLAQTEIKGHMRNESDLLNELALARADWACAQARIAELEKERDQQERFKWEANKRADKFKETLEKIEAEAYAHHELAGDIARSALRVKSRA